MRSSKIFCLIFAFSLLMAPVSQAQAAASKKNSASSQVKSLANPMVPYAVRSKTNAVLIPQSLAVLLDKSIAFQPQDTVLLSSISIGISRWYSEGFSFSNADELLNVLNNRSELGIHMEALRQGYVELLPIEKKDLIIKLFKRYEKAPDDAMGYFDYGYAQLLYLNNQTGLFYLRKANDKLQSQFTALAYAMAQAQVELNQEKGKPEEMTMRKLDVIYKLQDALAHDVQTHQPGFWPAYIQLIQRLADFSAYQDFTARDFSLSYVPLGKKMHFASLGGPRPSQESQEQKGGYALLSMAGKRKHQKGKNVSSKQDNPETVVNEEPLIAIRSLPNSGYLLKFLRTADEHQIKVVILDPQNRVQTSFFTSGDMDIVEDIDRDGIYELVVRQYRQMPQEPVQVYRLTENGYVLDQELHNKFL